MPSSEKPMVVAGSEDGAASVELEGGIVDLDCVEGVVEPVVDVKGPGSVAEFDVIGVVDEQGDPVGDGVVSLEVGAGDFVDFVGAGCAVGVLAEGVDSASLSSIFEDEVVVEVG